MTRLAASKARDDFAEVLNRVAYRGERIVLHRRGKNVAVIIPVAEYEFLERLVEEAENRGDLEAIQEAKKEIERGETIPWEQLKKDLAL
ncbi:MAG: type II toxin-antitoxin system Phd/YefM family antitoxin [Candidatus Sumerlaeota bacterium]|nr:type II toxin-antitoxin system Phd/YefM family antitoxin [Candidatus Sumerlaeota bacterium]